MRPALSVRVELPVPFGLSEIDELLSEDWSLGPELVTDTVTVPLKPLMLVRVITLVAEELRVIVNEDGLADMEKSPIADTVSVRFVECDSDPEEPVTVMV